MCVLGRARVEGGKGAAKPQAGGVPGEGRCEKRGTIPLLMQNLNLFLILELLSVNPVPLLAPQSTAKWLPKERAG